MTILVGLSRVYLGVHYPSDVLAGWCVGTAWALLCWAMTFYLQSRGKVEGPSQTGGQRFRPVLMSAFQLLRPLAA